MRRSVIPVCAVLLVVAGAWAQNVPVRPNRSRSRQRPQNSAQRVVRPVMRPNVQPRPQFHGTVQYRRPPTTNAPVRVQRQAWTQPPAAPAKPLLERLHRVVTSVARPMAAPPVPARMVPNAHPIRDVRHFIRDAHLIHPPMMDIKGRPIAAHPINNPPVQHKAIVQNPNLMKDIQARQHEELQTERYYWHDDGGVNYCHYLDRRGHHWYGFYNGQNYYWTRYQGNRWWWYDPAPQSWVYYDDGYWWNQNQAQPQEVNVYVNGGYVPYNPAQPPVDIAGGQMQAVPAQPAEPPIHSDVDTPNYQAPENENAFAVVVGVEDYGRLPKADFAQRDAEAVRAHLAALGYPTRNVAVLSEDQASLSGIEKHVEAWLAEKVNADSRVLFYFSGHGAPDPKTGQTYLMPWDGDPKYLANTGYPLSRLFAKLNALPSHATLVVLDTCFSGSGGRSVLAEGTRPLVTRVDLGRASIGDLTVLTASAGDEVTGTSKDQGHGLLTYYFLKGLNGEARASSDGVSVQDLYEYLRPKVEDAARLDNREQSPQLMVPPYGQRQMLVKDLR